MASINFKDEAEWKLLRAKHVGASEVAALFSLSPWLTRWQLYQLKRGALPDVFDNKSMAQGRHFEPAVAAYAQERFSIQLRKVHRYLSSDDVVGLGASLDYEEYGDGSLIPTELKFSLWGDGWEWEGDELTAIPDNYMLQVQHQLACVPNTPHAQLIAFTGGDLKRMIIPRSDRLIIAIKAAVASFWADVAAGNEPPVDFNADADAVNRLAYIRKLRSVVMTPDVEPLFYAWDHARADVKDAETRMEAAKTEIMKRILDAGEGNDSCVVTCGSYRLSVAKVAESLGKIVSPEMVGTYIGARKGHLRTTLKRVEA